MQTIKHLGFNLLEMLVTLALVAILSLLGNVAYTHFIDRTHRLLAEQTLITAAASLERYALMHGNYEGGLTDLQLPENTSLGYRFDADVSATTYTITALPLANNHDACGRLSVNEAHETLSDNKNLNCFAS